MTNKMFFISICGMFQFLAVNAQAPDIDWQKLIGGSNGDRLLAMILTADGGSIIGGRSNSNISGDKTENAFNGQDYWVLKLDSSQEIEWQRTLGGVTTDMEINEQDYLSKILLTSDGGYLVGGWSDSGISGNKTEPCRGMYDYWIIKLNAQGETQWQKVFGGTSSDMLYDMANTTDGGLILGGSSGSPISGEKTDNSRGLADYWIIKLDAEGTIVWQKTIGGSGYDSLSTVVPTSDGGYIAGGTSSSFISGEKTENSFGSNDYWILKLDSTGNIQWQKTIGGSGYDGLSTIFETDDGGYFVAGYSNSPISGLKSEVSRGLADYWVMKLDALGNIEWQKTIGGEYVDELGDENSSFKCADGYIVSGASYSGISGDKTEALRGVYDTWIIKLDLSGNLIWQKTIGGFGSDSAAVGFQMTDGSFMMAGATDSSNSGDITETSHGGSDYWLLKLNPEDLATPHSPFAQTVLWPNPATQNVMIRFGNVQEKISVSLTNILGQQVSGQVYQNTETLNYRIDGASGVYFLKVENGVGEHKVFKVIKK